MRAEIDPGWGGLSGCGGLAGGQGEQLGGEGLDLALDRCGVQAWEGVFHDRLVLGTDLFLSLRATMWPRGDVGSRRPNAINATEVFTDRAALDRQESLPEAGHVMALFPEIIATEPDATIFEVASSSPYGA